MSSNVGTVLIASIAALLVGPAACSASAESGPTASACAGKIPPALAPPAGNELAFELRAEGVQIYACASSSGAAASWALQAPEAALIDRRGVRAGTHGAGPTWEALDGSSVVGAKVEAATPDPSAIPWLLLRAVDHRGDHGRMADVTFVQRLATSGGTAPSKGCGPDSVGAVARVPYRAVYCFYRAGPRL
ncbi:MAG TPA: DUF3455 domain-containing protein [Anaeromyxobacteraceae bacterium]|jgi:hypothetical protein|nr:DUF3455 domain-containing protein [Anaeromyxobacteraceae bacterium]